MFTDEKEITICNIYAPNDDRLEFFVELFNTLREAQGANVIIGGDFNMVADPEWDRQGSVLYEKSQSSTIVETYMDEMEMCDIWMTHNPDKTEFTWYRMRPSPVFSRLDRFIINMGLSAYVGKIEHLPGFKTDHSIVFMQVQFSEEQRGPGGPQKLLEFSWLNMQSPSFPDTF